MRFFSVIIFYLLTQSITAQTKITGTITDAISNEPLIGVTVQVNDLTGTTTDENGNYEVLIGAGTLQLHFSYLGYKSATKTVKIGGEEAEQEVSIKMTAETSILNTVVVTDRRYGKAIADETVSIEVIQPQFIENNAITSLAEVMERVPGVQILDEQINIRSSGYSYGAGSRIGIVVDGQPLLAALASDIKWNFVPIENVGQIEVVKGASSVLYGAASMSGVVNITTANPTRQPYTSISIYRGISDKPKSPYRQWWDDSEPPGNVGVFFAHRVRANKTDVVLGGNVHFSRGHVERADENRARLNWKLKHHINDRLSFGLNGNVMYHKFGGYFIWQDADSNALQHISPIAFTRYFTATIDPHLTYFDKNENRHIFRGRYFNVTQENQIRHNKPNIPAAMTSAEYLFQKRFDNDLKLTTGAYFSTFYASDATLDVGVEDSVNAQRTDGRSIALFAQADKNFFDNQLNVVLGVRLEQLRVSSDFNEIVPVSRLGLNYKVNPTHVLRASFAQGYRLPSLLERYLETTLINFETSLDIALRALPNVELEPEIGWSSEIGYKKLFKTGSWKGYLDAAFFIMEYQNMVELIFDLHLENPENATLQERFDNLGFKYINAAHGRISGMELSVHLHGKIGQLPLRIWGGYTYTYPGDLDSIRHHNQNYFSNLFKAFSTPSAEIIPTILRYRSLHTARLDVEFYIKKLTLGFVANFNGHMHNIDEAFEGKGEWGQLIEEFNNGPIIPGLAAFRAEQVNGDWVFDLRLKYNVTPKHQVHFIVNNLLNREYALRVGRMNPLRTFNVKYQMFF